MKTNLPPINKYIYTETDWDLSPYIKSDYYYRSGARRNGINLEAVMFTTGGRRSIELYSPDTKEEERWNLYLSPKRISLLNLTDFNCRRYVNGGNSDDKIVLPTQIPAGTRFKILHIAVDLWVESQRQKQLPFTVVRINVPVWEYHGFYYSQLELKFRYEALKDLNWSTQKPKFLRPKRVRKPKQIIENRFTDLGL